jgi:hypothetical protein
MHVSNKAISPITKGLLLVKAASYLQLHQRLLYHPDKYLLDLYYLWVKV